MGQSDRGIKKTAQAIRYTLGRSSIEGGFSQFLTSSNKELSDMFEIRMFKMKRKPKKGENDEGNLELDEKGYLDYLSSPWGGL